MSGLLAISSPLNETCWIRIAAVDDDALPRVMLHALWDDLVPELRQLGIRQVAILVLRDWILPYLPDLGFRHIEQIVTMRRSAQPAVNDPVTGVVIRPSEPRDFQEIYAVDHRAFAPPWQLTRRELRQAHRVSGCNTVALLDEQIVGYQVSTLYFDGAHLARLAVDPTVQRRGIGGALMTDLLKRLGRRGFGTVTVNTQESNERSQRLYRRFGFVRNGYDMPVWMTDL